MMVIIFIKKCRTKYKRFNINLRFTFPIFERYEVSYFVDRYKHKYNKNQREYQASSSLPINFLAKRINLITSNHDIIRNLIVFEDKYRN